MSKFCSPSPLVRCLKVRAITFFANDFDEKIYSDTLFSNDDLTLPKELINAVSCRKAEFLCGRQTAKRALIKLGSTQYAVPIGENRAPVFPPNIVGSISHSHKSAICAVALSRDLEYVGIDLEHLIDSDLIDQIESQVITAAEKRMIFECGLSAQTGFTLIYSAKESLFKSLYNEVGAYFDFDAAKLIDVNVSSKQISFELTQTLAPNLPIGTRVSGQVTLHKNTVLTLIYKHRI
jgi:enterobactin synthetase component D